MQYRSPVRNRCDIPRLTQSFDLPPPELDPPTAAWLLWQHGFSRRRDREKVPYLRRLSSLVAGLAVTTFLGSPFGPALAQDAATSAALAGEAAHAQKMGKLFPDTGTGTQATPAVIPTVDNDDDPSGKVQTFQPNGPTKTANNAFFQALGTNGRSCFTCHQSQDAWTISAQHVRDRFDENPNEPLFRLIDGANCPSDDVSTPKAKRKAYSLLLNMGLIRSGIAFPSSSLPRQFEILSVDDPYNCTTNSTTGLSAIPTTSTTTGAVSLYRRPLPTTNIGFLTTLQWDGREPDLFSLGLHSTRNHLQSTTDPTPAQLQQMVTFEGCDTQNQSTKQGTTPASMLCANTPPGSGIFTAQISDDDAKHLDAAGARGGPKALSQDLAGFFIGINDPFGGNPTGASFRPDVFHLYDAWGDLPGHGPVNESREAIARGQDVFNFTKINITGVAGINDATGQPVFPGACATCHSTPSAGDHSVKAPLNIGIANGPTNPPPALDISGLPVFTVVCTSGSNLLAPTGTPFQVTDIGRAMISGKCADIGKFKGPILRGLAARAPYFHNGGAATLLDVVNFYDGRFGIGFTKQQKSDLVAFLSSL